MFIGHELSLMVLDLFDHIGMLTALQRYISLKISIPFVVVAVA